MEVVPAKNHDPNNRANIYKGKNNTESVDDMTGVEVRGSIPQVPHTFRYLYTAYPCLNEKQLGIGETTITGRKELQNKDGLFLIEELERIAQRFRKAGIKVQVNA